MIFSSTLLVAVYSAIYTWATDNWATAGLVGFAVFSTVTLRRTAVESMSGLKTLVSHVCCKKNSEWPYSCHSPPDFHLRPLGTEDWSRLHDSR